MKNFFWKPVKVSVKVSSRSVLHLELGGDIYMLAVSAESPGGLVTIQSPRPHRSGTESEFLWKHLRIKFFLYNKHFKVFLKHRDI